MMTTVDCMACPGGPGNSYDLCLPCREIVESAMRLATPGLIARTEVRYVAELDAFLDGPPPTSLHWWIGKPELAARRCAEVFARDDPWGTEMDLRFLINRPYRHAETDDPRPYFMPGCGDEMDCNTSTWLIKHLTPFFEQAIRSAIETLPTEQTWRDFAKTLRGACECDTDQVECMGDALEMADRLGESDGWTKGMNALCWLRYYVRKNEIVEWDALAWMDDADLLSEPARAIYDLVIDRVIGR